ncbi:hypothetical protein [Halobacterium bonnevillei]|uniref:Uncharacterized protein n=1 Tax=Halobacterium bonnevillei TaxID=2692200 RepID=A0A6B0SR35_9EURY|nr:hypothetical protein [Halobacterium bonnevillei]MXR22033.1 hypothetical protein [Halobacterium bonnevillei]
MRTAALDGALADAGADAFVFVGPPDDPLVRYLSGASLPVRAPSSTPAASPSCPSDRSATACRSARTRPC